MERTVIPTYVINLKRRVDRRLHIVNQFRNRSEFALHIVEASEHEVGAIGLWSSIRHILRDLTAQDDEFVIICEDDHEFTEHYSKEVLFSCIKEAMDRGADILSGGVSWFSNALQVSKAIFWSEKFTAMQFVVIYKRFFRILLESGFEAGDCAEMKISLVTDNIFFIYPFISIQKEFGYSDATPKNNAAGIVSELFRKSSACIQTLRDVSAFYGRYTPEETDLEWIANVTLPVYVINLPERHDRLKHIQEQFSERREFNVNFVEACKHRIGALGLWKSIRKITQMAIDNDDDVMIICEDDHEFTQHYSKEYLIKNIVEAHAQSADYLSGGAGGFGQAVPITPNRFWINPCFSTQFIVVFKKFFKRILDEPFGDDVKADQLLSEMTGNKMVLYPFISIQKDFGYSDVTSLHDRNKGLVTDLFEASGRKFRVLQENYIKYLK